MKNDPPAGPSPDREQLERAIAAQESLRDSLGSEVVDAAVTALREKLEALAPIQEETRRQVTILFADVSGFTSMAETRDAEEVSAAMNELWRRVDGVILENGGTIDKHMGDAVMALWGASGAREDDPERAITAALAIQRDIDGLELAGRPVRVRVGINTGMVLVGRVGSKGETTAVGDAVNVASRLEEMAAPGAILVSHDTYRHVRGVFEVREEEAVAVRGRGEPVRVYTVLAAKRRAFRLSTRGVEGIETRMIGRESELRALIEMLRETIDERDPRVVTVFGEAGLGKSRLMFEFASAVELLPDRVRVFTARAHQEMPALQFALVRDLFASRFGIQESDPIDVKRGKFENGMEVFLGPGEESRMMAHIVGQLIGLDFSTSPFVKPLIGNPRQIRDRALRYAAEFMRRVTQELPALILLEDIHWADNGSLDFVDQVTRACEGARMFVLCLARPSLLERRPSWGEGMAHHQRIDLRPLTKRQSRQLVEDILRQSESVPEVLREVVVGSAEGNPFYVEELIKMLIDQGVIQPTPEVWRVDARRLVEVRVPPTLTGIIQARLDRLSRWERVVLQRASIVGREFWAEAIERMGEEPASAVGQALESLRGKEIIYRHEASQFEDDVEFTFKHALLRDVTYESVLKRDRVAWHRVVATWLVDRSGGDGDRFAAVIADHFERAGIASEAAEWYGRAARHEQRAYAHETAIDYYRRAIDFASEAQAVSGESGRQRRIEWYRGMAEALGVLARFDDAIDAYEKMRAAAAAAGDKVAEARAWNGRGFIEQRKGDYQGLLASAERAEELAAEAGDLPEARIERVVALVRMSDGYFRLGAAEEQEALAARSLELATSLGEAALREQALSLKLLGMASQVAGRFEEARRRKEQALEIFRRLGDHQTVGMMLNSLGETLRLKGDYAAARDRYQEALSIARETGHRPEQILCLSNLAGARLGLGEFAEAERLLREAIDLAGPAGYHVLPEAYRFLAEACLGLGRNEDALEAARLALTLSRDESPDHLGHAWRVLGRVASRTGPEEIGGENWTPEACFEESVRVFQRSKMDSERARTLLDWGRHERETGLGAEAEARLEEARAIFERLGMAHDPEPAARAG
ncbi:MAG TPA: adenylate/guanylate cyclase domain-containing protein [Gemmatimonadota bacterium]|nr:adenylate/guanylate cyclase domain-containing protein [Gemmatimonadota bacterium]